MNSGGTVTAMAEHDLERLLGELRSTIEESQSLEADERQKLETLATRIEEQADEERHGLIDQLGDAVENFETVHPSLTQTLNRIANALSAGGI